MSNTPLRLKSAMDCEDLCCKARKSRRSVPDSTQEGSDEALRHKDRKVNSSEAGGPKGQATRPASEACERASRISDAGEYKHKITAVTPGSIGDSLGLCPGDFLLEIDGAAITDVFDYRMAVASEQLTVLIEKGTPEVEARAAHAEAELWELDIEKDEDEDLGLAFETALMDEVRTCENACIFCFIDGQPPGLRPSLYVKDDDIRLSFLHGNYVTLTNVSDAEAARIARLHLSPLRISVHTMDAALRVALTGHPGAGRLAAHLKRFNAAGIAMHFQAVLCKGYNDGPHLDETIARLLDFRPGAKSLAVVPAGVTRHREGCTTLAPFTPEDAAKVIKQVEAWQDKCRARCGSAFVYAADEWYIAAGCEPPKASECEDFPQLENGVGLCALFEKQFREAMKKDAGKGAPARYPRTGIVTGTAAAAFMHKLVTQYKEKHPGADIRVYTITNRFFGDTVTVSGLLTGQDIITALRPCREKPDIVYLPANAFRAGTEDMLDGTTRAGIEASLGIPVHIGSADGGEFYAQLIQKERICFNSPFLNK